VVIPQNVKKCQSHCTLDCASDLVGQLFQKISLKLFIKRGRSGKEGQEKPIWRGENEDTVVIEGKRRKGQGKP
jgi:hypothetical protein